MKRFAMFLSKQVRNFAGDRKGAVAVLVASGVIVMVATVGIATDAARGYLLKARLGQALDAAALAGGRAFFETTRDAEIKMYFDANFPPGFMGATVNGPIIIVDESAGTVRVTAEATIGTTFMRVLKHNSLKVGSSTEVTRETKALDLVIAMDMSTSMTWELGGGSTETRIEAARAAALELVTILYGADTFKDLLKIGVVPWAGKVNVTIDGAAYDPDVTYDTGATPPAAVSPTYQHPLTGATVTQHFFANNSPVPLLERPPGRATSKNNPGLVFVDTNSLRRNDGLTWESQGYVRGAQITITNADNAGNDDTYTIVKIEAGDQIKVYPSDLVGGGGTDNNADIAGVYNWPGCVYARYVVDGTVPNETVPWLTTNDSSVDFTNGSDPQFGNDADTELYAKDFQPPFVTARKWAAWEPVDGKGEPVPGSDECYMSPNNDGSECRDCLTHGITPLTGQRADVEAAINGLTNPVGKTNIPQGLMWAWRVLMPGSPFNEATANDDLTSGRQQAIIILTDGENTGGWGNSYKGVWGENSAARGEQDERLKTLAAKIKDFHNTNPHDRQDPIDIYAIQFYHDTPELKGLMQAVATKPHEPYYHFAPNKDDLAKVFKEVANHLTQLRISE